MKHSDLIAAFLGLPYVEQREILRLAVTVNKTKQLSCPHTNMPKHEYTYTICPDCGGVPSGDREPLDFEEALGSFHG